MKAPAHLPADVAEVWVEVVDAYGEGAEAIVGPALEAYCGQVATMRAAQAQVADEGLIVADPKGFAVPHPGLAIAKAAQAEVRAWGDQFRARRRGRSFGGQ